MRAAGVVLAALLGCAALVQAQTEGPSAARDLPLPKGMPSVVAHSTIEFSYVPRDAAQKPWRLRVEGDGSGTLQVSDETAAQPLRVSAETMAVLEAGSEAPAEHRCETRHGDVARTGVKKITYANGIAQSSCEFNFSDDDALNRAASAFIAMEETMAIGKELARLHRFDRLGLDAEMETLQRELDNGYAIEPGNIAAVLQSLADDDRVMDRVRRRAARILAATHS